MSQLRQLGSEHQFGQANLPSHNLFPRLQPTVTLMTTRLEPVSFPP